MKFSILLLLFAVSCGLTPFCERAMAEIWLCEYTGTDGQWFTTNPVNSDAQTCTPRFEIGARRFTTLRFPPPKKSEKKDHESLSREGDAPEQKDVLASEQENQRAKLLVDWKASELRPPRKRRGGIYASTRCNIEGFVFGEGPRLVRIQIRRGGATIDEVTSFLRSSRSRSDWKARLEGSCRNIQVRALPAD